ncbi:MAG: exodeoxyribonuclease V subunit gamma [Desulfobacterales bacterium]|jgi:exodeoxyribonuclease V gamma subunit
MSGLRIFSGNRLEILADRLAEVVSRPLATALEPETVIVQSRGMERWVSMALARRNGICANMAFPFPNAFLDDLFRRILPGLPDPSPFDPEILTFRIMKRLPAYLRRPAFADLKRYLLDDAKGVKLYQLAVRVADLFDQYLVFRPEMILRWEAGQGGNGSDELWQAELWRDLSRGKERVHRARLHRNLLLRLETLPVAGVGLPSRISVFGISYLPPFHLQVLAGLAPISPVYLFLLNPCREYWADILSRRAMHRLSRKIAQGTVDADALHMEQGHPLLASLGGLGKEFFVSISATEAHIEDCFVPVDEHSLLSNLQADIFYLRDQSDSQPADRVPVGDAGLTAADASIQIHACHGPLREIEVLHDRLLAMFEEYPDVRPRDVIVMTPDIVAYTPYIRAVFDTQTDAGHTIPYSIADQGAGSKKGVLRSFLSLLDLKGSRFEATRVLGLLEMTGIKERFGLTADDLTSIARWVRDVNIRWGRDAAGRMRIGLPGLAENTWQAGIDRLLLGYAMPGSDRRMFDGILPYDHIEGSEALVLGRFITFLQHLFEWAERLEQSMSPADWRDVFIELLERFIAVDENAAQEVQQLRRSLENFGCLEERAGFAVPLELEVVRTHLENTLERTHAGAGFISGGVTFCAMLPMRSIPFEVVCLIGMNTAAFPRENTPLGFDLMARFPRLGDRSRRRDDKYLFLEALVSAARVFYISYVGQSVQDNSEIPPSVIVSELIDAIEGSYGIPAVNLVIRHPLQAYSRRYFDDSDPALFSYSLENFMAAAGGAVSEGPQPFFKIPLAPPPADWQTLRLEQLCQFASQPARFLVEQRLGILLKGKDLLPQDKENFSLDALDGYRIRQDLIEARLSGHDSADHFQIQRAKGDLPQGNIGRLFYGVLEKQTEAFAAKLLEIIEDKDAETLPVDLTLSGIRLTGTLGGLYPQGRIQARFARRRAKDYLSAWIYHLVMCRSTLNGRAPVTTLVGADGIARIRPVDQPDAILKEILTTFKEGLCRPLHFFPDLSLHFLKLTVEGGKPMNAAIEAVRKKWVGTDFQRGVSEDPYLRLCFGGSDPIDEQFEGLAEKIVAPLLRHVEELP